MHLCFVDESGTPAKPGRDHPKFFVIAALILPEERWHGISAKLHGLKTRRAYYGELKWRFFSPDNDDDENPMADWKQPDKNSFRKEVFSIITGDKSVRVVACVCEAKQAYRLPSVTEQEDIYFSTYKVVTERFQYFLQDVSRTSGHRTLGIIVADHRGKGDDERFRNQHQRLVNESHEYTSDYKNLIEGLFLTPSHLSVGIQLVDLVAGAIWRRFEAGDSTWFDVIKPSFRCAANGAIDGYGVCRFPKNLWTGPVP
jgi:hypothetical protein